MSKNSREASVGQGDDNGHRYPGAELTRVHSGHTLQLDRTMYGITGTREGWIQCDPEHYLRKLG